MFDPMQEERLRQALESNMARRMQTLTENSGQEHVFSPVFVEKMEKLQRREGPSTVRRFPKSFRFLAAAAALLVLFTALLSVQAVREWLYKFVQITKPEYSEIHFEPTGVGRREEGPVRHCIPEYIPQGLEMEFASYKHGVQMEFEGSGDKRLSYSQDRVENLSVSVNTEGVTPQPIEINGFPGYYFMNMGFQFVYWYDDEYFYMVLTNLEKGEALKIAESVKEKKITREDIKAGMMEEYYLPAFVPEGYFMHSYGLGAYSASVSFQNDRGQRIDYDQKRYNGIEPTSFDENSPAKEVRVNGCKGILYYMNDWELWQLVYWDGRYVYTVQYNCDDALAMQVAESLKKLTPDALLDLDERIGDTWTRETPFVWDI